MTSTRDEQFRAYVFASRGGLLRIVVQAPAKLSWTSTQIVSFAEGVQVTGNAIAGRG